MPKRSLSRKATISGSFTAMRRWPVSRSVSPVKATEVDRVASSGGRPAASTSVALTAPQARLTAISSKNSARYGVFHSAMPRLSSATPSTAMAGSDRSMPPETTSSPPTAITQTRPKQRIASGTLCTSIMLIFCQLKKKGDCRLSQTSSAKKRIRGNFSISVVMPGRGRRWIPALIPVVPVHR